METPKLTFKSHLRRIEEMMDQSANDCCEVVPINRTPKPTKPSTIQEDIIRLHLGSPFFTTPVKTVGLMTSTPMATKRVKEAKKVNRILFNGSTPKDLRNESNERSLNGTKNLDTSEKKNAYSKLLMKSMNQSVNEVNRSWLTLA